MPIDDDTPTRTPLFKRALSAPPRSTPRPSGTPSRATLVELAHATQYALPTTPTRPARTPLARSTRRTPANRLNPKSPHALHALHQRRGLTPARDRRKSLGRGPMQSPMDIMRALSRKLAVQPDAAAKPSAATPARPTPLRQTSVQQGGEQLQFYQGARDSDDDTTEELPRPRTTVDLGAFGVDEDDEPELPPPTPTALDDVDRRYSIGLQRGRRAVSEDPYYRRESIRESLGFWGPSSGGIEEVGEDTRMSMGLGEQSGVFGGEEEEAGLMMLDEDGDATMLGDGTIVDLEDPGEFSAFAAPSPGRDPALQELEQEVADEDDDDDDAEDFGGPVEEYDEAALDEPELDTAAPSKPKKTRPQLLSAHNIPYPRLPAKVIKDVAGRFTNKRIGKDVLSALEKASNLFFEQVAGDLETYAEHAGRKTIDESDAVMLMKRQRVVGGKMTVEGLAEGLLHRELYTEVEKEMEKTQGPKKKRKRTGRVAKS